MSLATCTENGVNVRNVDGYYKDGSVYVVTHSCSQKMKDIDRKSNIAICKDLMCGQGIGENLGNPKYIIDYKNATAIAIPFVNDIT